MAGVQMEDRAPLAAATVGHPRLPRIASLDGLRGAAVLAVLAYHAELLDGGFLGVDLFFVLSGFLITALLLVERRTTGATSVLGFWARRARRLLPAVLMVVAAVAVYAATIAASAEVERIRSDGIATLLYVANWHDLAAGNDYWTLFARPSPLAHTWSLAIEEQFYLVWPLVVVLVTSRARRPAERVLSAGIIGAVLSALWLMTQHTLSADPSRSYLGTDTRISAILVGAVLAAYLEVTQGGVHAAAPAAGADHPAHGAAAEADDQQADDQPVEHPLALAGLVSAVVLGWMWWTADGTEPFLYQGGFALHAIASVGLIATLVHPEPTLLHRILALRPLVWVGHISYGLYLWHWPVFVVLDADRTGLSGLALTSTRVVVSFVLATASFYLVERPIRRRRVPDRILLLALPATIVVVAVGLWLGATGATGSVATAPQLVDERIVDPLANAPSVLLAGDSLALNVASGIQAVRFEQLVTVRTAGEPLCSVFSVDGQRTSADNDELIGGCGRYDSVAEKVRAVLDQSSVDVVVLAYGLPDVSSLASDGQLPLELCGAGVDSPWAVATGDAFVGLPDEVVGVLLTTPPIVGGAAGARVPVERGISLDELNRRITCHNELLAELAAASPQLELVDLAEWVCPEGTCRDEIAGFPMRPDGLHFGSQSAVNAGRWLLTQLDALGGLTVREVDSTTTSSSTTTVADPPT